MISKEHKANFLESSGGQFEANNDPEKRGRCRVRVFGIHTSLKVKTTTEGIPTDELPWAEPAFGLIEGSISGYGLFSIPLQGSHVFLFFENGNILQPRFFASVPGNPQNKPNPEEGFNDPDGVYPDKIDKPDYEESNSESGYLHSIVLKTHGGITIEINSKEGNKGIKIIHPEGSEIRMDNNGDIIISSENETKILSEEKCKIIASGGVEIDGGSGSLTGLVTGGSICAFTGRPHTDTSTDVFASKGKWA